MNNSCKNNGKYENYERETQRKNPKCFRYEYDYEDSNDVGVGVNDTIIAITTAQDGSSNSETKRADQFPEEFEICGSTLVLIPYKRAHVPKYHSWMSNEETLRLTGSEKLSLEEEYEMQKEWERDDKKCTFIILDKEKYSTSADELESIVGDTNLFFQEHQVAEIEVMIGEEWARGRGLAQEALELMIKFGKEKLGKSKYVAKIKKDNAPSIHIFSKLGFIKTSQSDVFNEFTYEFTL